METRQVIEQSSVGDWLLLKIDSNASEQWYRVQVKRLTKARCVVASRIGTEYVFMRRTGNLVGAKNPWTFAALYTRDEEHEKRARVCWNRNTFSSCLAMVNGVRGAPSEELVQKFKGVVGEIIAEEASTRNA